jgi:CheY-like chemotaxis protein
MMQQSLAANVCNQTCKDVFMVVDDEEFNLGIMQYLLFSAFGVSSTSLADPELALRLFTVRMQQKCCNKQYSMVITDINMPVMSGIQFASRLISVMKVMPKKKGKKKEIPIIAATANRDEETETNALRAGIKIVLHKPVFAD